MKKNIKLILIVVLINLGITNLVILPFLANNGLLTFINYLKWESFWFFVLILFDNIFLSHRFASGKIEEWLYYFSVCNLISLFMAYTIFTISENSFNFNGLDWISSLNKILSFNGTYFSIQFIIFVIISLIYFGIFNKKMVSGLFSKGGLHGFGKLGVVEANLENSRWMKKEESQKLFKPTKFSGLNELSKDGVPVLAKLDVKGKDMDILFSSPCHSLIIGSTGSGKTTTFVNPMIQILASTKAGSSMIMTDPKGELFSLHSKYLKDRGYDVNVIDLRDTYQSYRWNPLDSIWDNYQNYVNAQNNVYKRNDNAEDSKLQLTEPAENFKNVKEWYEFDGKAFVNYDNLVNSIKVYKKKTFDEVYEDLNDLVSVLIPIENDKDPMWEKGARAITLAVLIAMLEDSEKPELNMTKDKFNFFNLTKILQNSNDDYIVLRKYFSGRNVLSKAYSLSKQVCDCADTTRASYMSVVYEKLTMFNDAGICALTSTSDFKPENLALRPTALFLKIPDEKSTRHNLAAIFLMTIYKALVKEASTHEDLSLPRNVYYILDEFGNMPKIENFDKMITVGRSRKIWFNMIIQSYAQLNNVYGDKIADIVKGNCGIKMFIGSNDMNTCKEYSELCGNITVVTKSTSSSGKDINTSSQTQTRPLIYPSELQRLNKPGDIGHSIIVTFGNYPLMTYFTPSFKVPFYEKGKMDTSFIAERFFDESKVLYDISIRNDLVLGKDDKESSSKEGVSIDIGENKDDNAEKIKEQEKEIKERNDDSDRKLLKFIKDFKDQNKGFTDDELIGKLDKVLKERKK
jgi:type IV secretion system protein VirD4